MTKIIGLPVPRRKPEKHDPEPEEIACAVIAVMIWIANMILFVRAL